MPPPRLIEDESIGPSHPAELVPPQTRRSSVVVHDDEDDDEELELNEDELGSDEEYVIEYEEYEEEVELDEDFMEDDSELLDTDALLATENDLNSDDLLSSHFDPPSLVASSIAQRRTIRQQLAAAVESPRPQQQQPQARDKLPDFLPESGSHLRGAMKPGTPRSPRPRTSHSSSASASGINNNNNNNAATAFSTALSSSATTSTSAAATTAIAAAAAAPAGASATNTSSHSPTVGVATAATLAGVASTSGLQDLTATADVAHAPQGLAKFMQRTNRPSSPSDKQQQQHQQQQLPHNTPSGVGSEDVSMYTMSDESDNESEIFDMFLKDQRQKSRDYGSKLQNQILEARQLQSNMLLTQLQRAGPSNPQR